MYCDSLLAEVGSGGWGGLVGDRGEGWWGDSSVKLLENNSQVYV